MVKFFGISVGLLFGTLVVASTILYFYFPKEKFESWLNRQSNKLGIEISYGDISITWGVPSTLVLSSCTIKSPETQLFAESKSAELSVDLWQSIKTFSMRAKVVFFNTDITHPKFEFKQSNIELTLSDVLLFSEKENRSQPGEIAISITSEHLEIKTALPSIFKNSHITLNTQIISEGKNTISLNEGYGSFTADRLVKNGNRSDFSQFPIRAKFKSLAISPESTDVKGLQLNLEESNISLNHQNINLSGLSASAIVSDFSLFSSSSHFIEKETHIALTVTASKLELNRKKTTRLDRFQLQLATDLGPISKEVHSFSFRDGKGILTALRLSRDGKEINLHNSPIQFIFNSFFKTPEGTYVDKLQINTDIEQLSFKDQSKKEFNSKTTHLKLDIPSLVFAANNDTIFKNVPITLTLSSDKFDLRDPTSEISIMNPHIKLTATPIVKQGNITAFTLKKGEFTLKAQSFQNKDQKFSFSNFPIQAHFKTVTNSSDGIHVAGLTLLLTQGNMSFLEKKAGFSLKKAKLTTSFPDMTLFSKKGHVFKHDKVVLSGRADQLHLKRKNPITIDHPHIEITSIVRATIDKSYAFQFSSGSVKLKASHVTQNNKPIDVSHFPLSMNFKSASIRPEETQLKFMNLSSLNGDLVLKGSKNTFIAKGATLNLELSDLALFSKKPTTQNIKHFLLNGTIRQLSIQGKSPTNLSNLNFSLNSTLQMTLGNKYRFLLTNGKSNILATQIIQSERKTSLSGSPIYINFSSLYVSSDESKFNRLKLASNQFNWETIKKNKKYSAFQSKFDLTFSELLLASKKVPSTELNDIAFNGSANQFSIQGKSLTLFQAPSLTLTSKFQIKPNKPYALKLQNGTGKFLANARMHNRITTDLSQLPTQFQFDTLRMNSNGTQLTNLKSTLIQGNLAIRDTTSTKNTQRTNNIVYTHADINRVMPFLSPKHVNTISSDINLSVNTYQTQTDSKGNLIPNAFKTDGTLSLNKTLLKDKRIQDKVNSAISALNKGVAKIREHLDESKQEAKFVAPDFQKTPSDTYIDFIARGDVLNIQRFKLLNESTQINGSGKVFLSSKKLDLNFEVTLYGSKQESAKPILAFVGNKQGDLVIPIHVSGTTENPKYYPRTSQMAKQAKDRILADTLSPLGIIKKTGKGAGKVGKGVGKALEEGAKGFEKVFEGFKGLFD